MRTLEKTACEILNATADDCENLEQIYRQVCFEWVPTCGSEQYVYQPLRGAPLLSEIAEGVHTLVEQGLLVPVMDENGPPVIGRDDLSYVWRAWFNMTPEGRSVWESSAHLLEHR